MSTPSPEQQKRARIFGLLFALTFVTSIAGLLLTTDSMVTDLKDDKAKIEGSTV